MCGGSILTRKTGNLMTNYANLLRLRQIGSYIFHRSQLCKVERNVLIGGTPLGSLSADGVIF